MPAPKKSKFSLFWKGVKGSKTARYLSGREQAKKMPLKKKKKKLTLSQRRSQMTNKAAWGRRYSRKF